jgi:hypothetical protein
MKPNQLQMLSALLDTYQTALVNYNDIYFKANLPSRRVLLENAREELEIARGKFEQVLCRLDEIEKEIYGNSKQGR